jgi:hypothetical protein
VQRGWACRVPRTCSATACTTSRFVTPLNASPSGSLLSQCTVRCINRLGLCCCRPRQTEFKKSGSAKPDFQLITGCIHALDHVLNSFCDVLQTASAADAAALYKCVAISQLSLRMPHWGPRLLTFVLHCCVPLPPLPVSKLPVLLLLMSRVPVVPASSRAPRCIFELSVTIPEDLTRFAVPEVILRSHVMFM